MADAKHQPVTVEEANAVYDAAGADHQSFVAGVPNTREALEVFLARRRTASLTDVQREALERAQGHFASLDDAEHMIAIGQLLEGP